MPKRKRPTQAIYPYDQLRTAIKHGRRPQWWLVVFGIVGVSAAAISWYYNAAAYSWYWLVWLAFLHGSIAVALIACGILANDNLGFTDSEAKLLAITIDALRLEHYTDEILSTIDRRAEVGSGAGQ